MNPNGSSVTVVGIGCDDRSVRQVADHYLGRTGSSTPPPEGTVVAVFDGSNSDDMSEAVAPPVSVCLDVAADGPLPELHDAPTGNLIVRLATATAYALPAALTIAGTLAGRLEMTEDQTERVESALQEAIGNAVLHGNLELDGRLRANIDTLAQFSKQMEQRLFQPGYARRPLDIAASWTATVLRLVVRDQGPGFNHEGLAQPTTTAATGRGIALIRELADRTAFSEEGRQVEMEFDR